MPAWASVPECPPSPQGRKVGDRIVCPRPEPRGTMILRIVSAPFRLVGRLLKAFGRRLTGRDV